MDERTYEQDHTLTGTLAIEAAIEVMYGPGARLNPTAGERGLVVKMLNAALKAAANANWDLRVNAVKVLHDRFPDTEFQATRGVQAYRTDGDSK